MKLFLAATALLFAVTTAPPASATDESQLAPPTTSIPPSFFGMHIHHMVRPNGNAPPTPWPNLTVPGWRLWDARVTWPDLEPAKGKWNFDTLDKSLNLAERH